MTKSELKRHFGWTPNFKHQPSEEERIERLKKLIEETEADLKMYREMLEEKDLW